MSKNKQNIQTGLVQPSRDLFVSFNAAENHKYKPEFVNDEKVAARVREYMKGAFTIWSIEDCTLESLIVEMRALSIVDRMTYLNDQLRNCRISNKSGSDFTEEINALLTNICLDYKDCNSFDPVSRENIRKTLDLHLATLEIQDRLNTVYIKSSLDFDNDALISVIKKFNEYAADFLKPINPQQGSNSRENSKKSNVDLHKFISDTQNAKAFKKLTKDLSYVLERSDTLHSNLESMSADLKLNQNTLRQFNGLIKGSIQCHDLPEEFDKYNNYFENFVKSFHVAINDLMFICSCISKEVDNYLSVQTEFKQHVSQLDKIEAAKAEAQLLALEEQNALRLAKTPSASNKINKKTQKEEAKKQEASGEKSFDGAKAAIANAAESNPEPSSHQHQFRQLNYSGAQAADSYEGSEEWHIVSAAHAREAAHRDVYNSRTGKVYHEIRIPNDANNIASHIINSPYVMFGLINVSIQNDKYDPNISHPHLKALNAFSKLLHVNIGRDFTLATTIDTKGSMKVYSSIKDQNDLSRKIREVYDAFIKIDEKNQENAFMQILNLMLKNSSKYSFITSYLVKAATYNKKLNSLKDIFQNKIYQDGAEGYIEILRDITAAINTHEKTSDSYKTLYATLLSPIIDAIELLKILPTIKQKGIEIKCKPETIQGCQHAEIIGINDYGYGSKKQKSQIEAIGLSTNPCCFCSDILKHIGIKFIDSEELYVSLPYLLPNMLNETKNPREYVENAFRSHVLDLAKTVEYKIETKLREHPNIRGLIQQIDSGFQLMVDHKEIAINILKGARDYKELNELYHTYRVVQNNYLSLIQDRSLDQRVKQDLKTIRHESFLKPQNTCVSDLKESIDIRKMSELLRINYDFLANNHPEVLGIKPVAQHVHQVSEAAEAHSIAHENLCSAQPQPGMQNAQNSESVQEDSVFAHQNQLSGACDSQADQH